MTLQTTAASLNFWTNCNVCGGAVQVTGGYRQAHRCRIDLDRTTTTNEGTP